MPAEVAVNIPPLPPVIRGPDVCANCGTLLRGPFCSECGQNVRDVHRSVWRFVADFFDNAFCWDNKLFLTLKPLLTRPGALTLDYLGGRRVRYVHPLRLFLFTSFICLGFIQYFGGTPFSFNTSDKTTAKKEHRSGSGASSGHESPSPSPTVAAVAPVAPLAPVALPAASTAAAPSPAKRAKSGDDDDDDAPAAVGPAGLSDEVTRAVTDGLKQAQEAVKKQRGEIRDLDIDPPDEDFGARIARKTRAKIKADGGTAKMEQEFTDRSQRWVSWVALALLPIFAGMLRALYWRRESFYFAHFVFSLHYHTFLLLMFALSPLLQLVLPTSLWPVHALLRVALLALPGWYLFLALRRIYGESVRRTTAKVLVLGAMHISVLTIGLLIVGGVAFLHAVGY